MESLPYRRSCRALLVDERDNVLLVEHSFPGGSVWTCPGGGIEGGETPIAALGRELREELGLALPHDASLVPTWTQHLPLAYMGSQGFSGVINEVFLVRVPHFSPTPEGSSDQPGHPSQEGILNMRWWTMEEVTAAADRQVLFGPRDLPHRLPALLAAIERDDRSAPDTIYGE